MAAISRVFAALAHSNRRGIGSRPTIYDLDLIFQALSHPTRRAIIARLSSRDYTVTELAKPYQISLAAGSKHIKVLVHAQILQKEKGGVRAHLRLNLDSLQAASQGLTHTFKRRLD